MLFSVYNKNIITWKSNLMMAITKVWLPDLLKDQHNKNRVVWRSLFSYTKMHGLGFIFIKGE